MNKFQPLVENYKIKTALFYTLISTNSFLQYKKIVIKKMYEVYESVICNIKI